MIDPTVVDAIRRAIVRADLDPDLVRKGLAAFDASGGALAADDWDGCFVARMYGPVGALRSALGEAQEHGTMWSDDDLFLFAADRLGLAPSLVRELADRYDGAPEALHAACVAYLADQEVAHA